LNGVICLGSIRLRVVSIPFEVQEAGEPKYVEGVPLGVRQVRISFILRTLLFKHLILVYPRNPKAIGV
jgi:hypothetical protein